ncbi:MAG: adenosine kinase [Pseudomonadota bacterium]|nr:adenosine kinase [Pseudomonadota bacterium]
MSQPRFDVIAIGNAIVDVMAPCDDALVAQLAMAKGGMTLVDTPRALALYDAMGPAREISGGSAANTLAGIAALGGCCAFIGQVADDQLGQVFAHDIRAAGVEFSTPPRGQDPSTARCLIFVTPDGQRTMNTYLGASQFLPAAALDESLIADAAVLYLEGYLWDPEEPRNAMRKAIAAARRAGRKIAFSLSDAFVIARHGDDFRKLIASGEIDLLFANEAELAALTGLDDVDAAIAELAPQLPVLVVTRGAMGAVAVSAGERADVPAHAVAQVIDTTGAGDLFAAGFLFGHVRGKPLAECLTMGAICAAEIISHYGARPEADLRELVG